MWRRIGGIACIIGVAAAVGACSSSPKSSKTASPISTSLSSLPSSPKKVGINSVQMATSVAKNGSAANPATAFKAATVRTIIAVISLENLPAGTRISYIRYLDGAFVNSKTASLTRASKYFYFKFNALNGKSFAKGHYRLRLYVNGHLAIETSYDVY
ncbi:MAG: hypothetical protein ACYDCC_06360 [Actinomycetota bacterium]